MRIRHVYESNVNSRLTQVGPQFRMRRDYYAVYSCLCGNHTVISVHEFRSCGTRSCGCLNTESILKRNTSHGLSKTPEYKIWCGIVKRCTNPNAKSYSSYCNLGMCDEWKVFTNFLADMGQRPSPKHSIDRIDNTKGYTPENCRWATAKQQVRNRSVSFWITAYGKTMLAVDWQTVYGVPAKTIKKRIQMLKWSAEKAVSVPPRKLP